MLLLLLTYSKPMSEVEALLPAHLHWLDTHYGTGSFVASGRLVPRTGGAILMRTPDRATAEAIADADPFVTGAVATYQLLEIAFSRATDDLTGLLST